MKGRYRMKLIAGLGNYGKEYKNTRHNIGFMALDYYAQKNNLSIDKKKFKGLYAETMIENQKVISYLNNNLVLLFHLQV